MAVTQTNPTDETVAIDAQLSDREVRALTEPMTVIDNMGVVKDADGLYEVTSTSTYIVDLGAHDGPRCSCKDHQYRGVDCAHIERARYATGKKALPSWIDQDELDDQLGEHVESGHPRIAMTDGGMQAMEGNADAPERDSDPRDDYIPIGVDLEGGHHVYRTTDETVFAIEGGEITQRYDVSDCSVNKWIDYVEHKRGWRTQELYKTMAGALGGAL